MLRSLVIFAAAAMAEAYLCASPVMLGGKPAGAVAARRAALPAVRPAGRLALRSGAIKVEGGKSDEEECEGPATSGEVGDVDMSAAKVSAGEIKTDGIINLTPEAIAQITTLRKSRGQDEVVLRVGVRAGGCSGMSYVMEFEDDASKVAATDTEIKYDGFRVVVDPKSLMFVYGMTLNYSDALIGGGFQFSNPNAESTCGCGQSFGA